MKEQDKAAFHQLCLGIHAHELASLIDWLAFRHGMTADVRHEIRTILGRVK